MISCDERWSRLAYGHRSLSELSTATCENKLLRRFRALAYVGPQLVIRAEQGKRRTSHSTLGPAEELNLRRNRFQAFLPRFDCLGSSGTCGSSKHGRVVLAFLALGFWIQRRSRGYLALPDALNKHAEVLDDAEMRRQVTVPKLVARHDQSGRVPQPAQSHEGGPAVTSFHAVASREGKWWMISIPALDGLTQARRLSEATQMASEYIAASQGIPLDDVAVEMTFAPIGALDDITERVAALAAARNRLERLEREASSATMSLAHDLEAERVPLRDIGAILGLSHQRAHQLTSGRRNHTAASA